MCFQSYLSVVAFLFQSSFDPLQNYWLKIPGLLALSSQWTFWCLANEPEPHCLWPSIVGCRWAWRGNRYRSGKSFLTDCRPGDKDGKKRACPVQVCILKRLNEGNWIQHRCCQVFFVLVKSGWSPRQEILVLRCSNACKLNNDQTTIKFTIIPNCNEQEVSKFTPKNWKKINSKNSRKN